jgi:Amidase
VPSLVEELRGKGLEVLENKHDTAPFQQVFVRTRTATWSNSSALRRHLVTIEAPYPGCGPAKPLDEFVRASGRAAEGSEMVSPTGVSREAYEMALSDELAYLSATELALRIRRRDLSPVEVVDAFVARIEARNPSINAFVYLGFEDARQRAKAAEQELMSGAALGPLHGVPVAIKDLFDFKHGWPSTFGGVRAQTSLRPASG